MTAFPAAKSGLPEPVSPEAVRADVLRAFAEDIGQGDASAGLIAEDSIASARIICREAAVLSGADWCNACFLGLDPEAEIAWQVHDGQQVPAETVLCTIRGRARALLSAERTALNFLQTLSGTATTTARYVAAAGNSTTVILDTRKTLPGLRLAQKYAVRCGGGGNHRMGLYDAILVKENHIVSAGGIRNAVATARKIHPELMLEVEVENLAELDEAMAAGVDRIMLDEFATEDIRKAVAIAKGKVQLEVSGSVDLARIGELATLGVDYISVGALTKNVQAIDLSMRFENR